MSKIGIGVTTTNPKEYAKRISSLLGDPKNYFLCYKSNLTTVANDKNYLIDLCYKNNCDYIVLFDDDTFPIKADWEQFFIDGHLKTGIHHFIVGNPVNCLYQNGNEDVSCYLTGTGCMLFLTRKVIDTVGYINPAYGKFGYEHVAYSHRIRMAGLTPAWYVSLNGWEEYIYAWDLDKGGAEKYGFVKEHCISPEEKIECIKANEAVFNKEVLSQKLYYDYTIEPTD